MDKRKSYILVNLWWDRSNIIAECLECDNEWLVERLGEDWPRVSISECSIREHRVLCLNCPEASTEVCCGS